MSSQAAALEDHSRSFAAFRTRLIGQDGRRYVEFLGELRPDYRRIHRDIGAGYLLLIVSFVLAAAAPSWGVPAWIAAAVGTILIGYWVAYLQLFIHEGAHYNLAPSRTGSDRLCDLAISWMIGTTVAAYRTVHFQHHRELGTTRDSEFTYFFPLDLTFLLKAAFGVRAAEVMLSRLAFNAAGHSKETVRPLLICLAVHGTIVAASLLAGWWWAALAWVLGTGLAFPFFGALRQLLEHRSETADPKADYRKQDHGVCTRLFRDGPLAATFGAAGFSRHLLHHWEPQVSYTNLAQLEAFLDGTELKAVLDARRTTYLATFRRLYSF
ncbi:MAG TPA: fatty acid desaturase [Methylomirabilota bacterium]|nr:fatty acid desaturase [Methylomirabilota bacterium]